MYTNGFAFVAVVCGAVGSGELDRISKQMRGIFSKHGSHTSLPEEAELRTCERPNRC